jgi:hypothetical protein
MQKKSIRIISNAAYHAHTSPLFIKHHILPLKHLITQTSGILTHSIIHKYSPTTLHNTWLFNYERNPERDLRNANELYVPRAINEQLKRSPYFALPVMWNNLPYDRMQPNPLTFKIALNEFLWRQINEGN